MTGDPLVRLRRNYGYSMKTIAMNSEGLIAGVWAFYGFVYEPYTYYIEGNGFDR